MRLIKLVKAVGISTKKTVTKIKGSLPELKNFNELKINRNLAAKYSPNYKHANTVYEK